jgi:hypothetical protein
MFQGCRPAGRLFYWVLAVVVAASSVRVSGGEEVAVGKPGKAASYPTAKPSAAEPLPGAASPAPQSGLALTSVIDTVYMADGSTAQGVLIITWPAFVAVNGTAVAPGALDVTLGTNGALNVAVAPNAGATPANVYYTVVYQLQPSEVRTEYWVVPTSSPATLAQVRTTPGSGTAAQPVSMQYVNSALAAKANDSAVVHLAGAETVTGTKSFVAPPNVPTPVGTGDVTNKAYVDSAIATVGAGNYLPTAGGAMTGTLTLSGNPTAPLQASDKQYVDLSAAAKADLVSGLVPTGELGSGAASGLNCLLGNGTWGSCGSSANATEIQSVPVGSSAPSNGQVLTYSSTSGQYAPSTPSGAAGGVVTGPGASQNIAQPVGTELSVNNLSGIRYVTPTDNWSVSPSGSLIGGTQATVTLTPCPIGVDTSGNSMYFVYLSGQGTPEPAMVTGGTCTGGAASGTIVFTPKNTHSATYILSSASSGIQEAINDACGVPNGSGGNPNARVVLPATGATANGLSVYGSIFAHCSRTLIEGNGTLLSCSTRDRCVVLGDLVNSNHYGAVTIRGVNLTSTVNADGCQITNAQRQSNVVTITVASGCSTIQTGDLININFTDTVNYWGSHGPVTVSGTSITYSQTGANLASTATPGTVAIQNAAIEDNALPGTMEDIKYTTGGGGKFNQFFVVDNDQAATIRNFDNGAQGLLCTANHCGSFVYSAGTTAATPVLWLDKLNISAQCGGNGVTVYANNSTRINDSVIQGFAMWGIYTSTILGSYGGTQLDNVYNEEGTGPCPNPYMGNTFGAAGIIYSSGGSPLSVRGGEQPNGWMPEFANTGSTQYNYYVVVHDATEGVSYPLYAGYALSNGSGNIVVQWPHVAPIGSVTYDLVRMAPGTLAANNAMFPVQGACGGGSPTACGSVATNLAQCSGLVCSYTDSASASTASYTVATPGYFPALTFWPGGLVLNGNGQQNAGDLPGVVIDTDAGIGSGISSPWISTAGFLRPAIYARQCSGTEGAYGGAWVQCLEGDGHGNSFPGVGAVLLNSGPNSGAQKSGLKGRLNFIMSPADDINQSHIITLVDSNPAKTLATGLNRPANDAADTYIGLDPPVGGSSRSSAQLAFGAPVAISSYIGNAGDNASFLERLTSTAKTFNVGVNINGNLTVTGSCTGCGGGGGSGTVNSGTAAQMALYSTNGAAVSGDSGLTDNGSTLNYTGSNGISAAAGAFGGNVTVNGQLLVAGPWMVSSPIPGTAMAAAGAGTSALGISNDGNFYISASAGTPQKVATTATSSYFSNLIQEDANDLGEYNGTTAQNLHVYSSYTNSSTWQRTSLGYDATDSYAVVRSENSTSGAAPGLGFWVNNGLKWVVDPSSNFKPWADQTSNIGSFNSAGSGSGLRPGTIYAAGNSATGSGFELGKFASESYELCNDTTNGTIVAGLAVLTSAGCAAKPGSGLTSGAIGVVIANGGTAGVATLARAGSAYCSFDGSATVVGDYVVPSTTANGGFYPLCHDTGATRPTGTQILGRVLQASAGGTTVQIFLDMPGSNVSSSGTSAGTGSCTNQAVTAVLTGGPTCTTITSTYVDSSIAATASPALSGTPTAPTAAANTNTTQVATTAFVLGQASSTTPNMDGTAAVGTSNTFARADHVHPTDTSRIGGGGNLVSGNYPKANATGTVTDSGVAAGPYSIPWFTTNTTGTAITFSSTANKAELWGAVLTFPLTTTQVTYYVSTADNTTNMYDIGVLNSSGNIVAHIGNTAGTTFAASVGWKTVNWAASATLQPGRYYLAITSSCTSTCAQVFGGSTAGFSFVGGPGGTSESVTAGGTLNGGMTIPADNPTEATILAWEIH